MDKFLFGIIWRASSWFHKDRYYKGTSHMDNAIALLSDRVDILKKHLKQDVYTCTCRPRDEDISISEFVLASYMKLTISVP